ncbi:sterol carrier protein domain-containing protein [Kitasatospora cineracea]|uniref:sterol carrier protein domain-containing protein n=1 Tax=Kitasatospora cineracea TaxID=88074 RepID=UPI0013C36D97|nr:sterol carrier protein domain-containing protein [Kitasatospora cineracea]
MAAHRAWHPHTGGAPVTVEELVAPAPGAARALLDFLLQLDLCTRVELRGRPLHEPLRHLLTDPRALRLTAGTDSLWARILDLPRLLEARLDAPERELTIDVADPLGFAAGLHTVTARPDGSTGCTSARRVPDLSLDVADLAAVLLGDTRPADLLAAGRLREHTTDSADLFARALGHRAPPHCSTRF